MVRSKLIGSLVFAAFLPATAWSQNEADPGRWEGPYEVGVNVIHAGLLTSGHVVGWAGKESATDAAIVWDPVSRNVLSRPAMSVDSFCSGMAVMADGRIMAAGGDIYPGHRDAQGRALGIRSAQVFRPSDRTFASIPDMPGGERWYPSVATLPDGRVFVWNGVHAGVINPRVDLYDPATNSWSAGAEQGFPLTYPRLHVLLSGEVFVSGGQPKLYDPAANSWRAAPAPADPNRQQGQGVEGQEAMVSVLLPYSATATSQRVLLAGGGNCNNAKSNAEIFTFDLARGTMGWQGANPLGTGRIHATPVLLPDGKVLVVGG